MECASVDSILNWAHLWCNVSLKKKIPVKLKCAPLCAVGKAAAGPQSDGEWPLGRWSAWPHPSAAVGRQSRSRLAKPPGGGRGGGWARRQPAGKKKKTFHLRFFQLTPQDPYFSGNLGVI